MTHPQTPQLLVVFAPSLWPFRSRLDRASWLLAGWLARGLSRTEGLVAYLTPNSLVNPRALESEATLPLVVPRALPPLELLRQEAKQLGASWTLTGRLLEDQKGLEFWLNLQDGPSGSLLWTKCQRSPRHQFLFGVLSLMEDLLKILGFPKKAPLGMREVFPTASWPALQAFAEALTASDSGAGRRSDPIAIIRLLSRALSMDPSFEEAQSLLSQKLDQALPLLTSKEEVAALESALSADPRHEKLKSMRQRVRDHTLALAKHLDQT